MALARNGSLWLCLPQQRMLLGLDDGARLTHELDASPWGAPQLCALSGDERRLFVAGLPVAGPMDSAAALPQRATAAALPNPAAGLPGCGPGWLAVCDLYLDLSGISAPPPEPLKPPVVAPNRRLTVLYSRLLTALIATAVLAGASGMALVRNTLPGFVAVGWFALQGPKTLPGDVASKINADLNQVLNNPEVVARLRDVFLYANPKSLAESAAFIKNEVDKWAAVIRKAGITAQ